MHLLGIAVISVDLAFGWFYTVGSGKRMEMRMLVAEIEAMQEELTAGGAIYMRTQSWVLKKIAPRTLLRRS